MNDKLLSFPYTPLLVHSDIQGIDHARPWNLIEEIIKTANDQAVLLDIGCGTAKKIVLLAPHFKSIIGVEPNLSMLNSAKLATQKYSNIELIEGYAEHLPVKNNTCDRVTAMLAPHDPSEIFRVLRPGGVALLEKIGEFDKNELKELFGDDDLGPRGYRYGEKLKDKYTEALKQYFSKMDLQEGIWETEYSFSGLLMLLEQTPTIRGFDRTRDQKIIDRLKKRCLQSGSIRLKQHRLLIRIEKG